MVAETTGSSAVVETVDQKIELARKVFAYQQAAEQVECGEELKKSILEDIQKGSLGPSYERICGILGWEVDDMTMQRIREENEKVLKEMDAKIQNAEENEGETEVRDAMLAKANYLAKIGDREAARKAFDETAEKTAGSGPKLDLVFSMLRLDLSRGDWKSYASGLEEAKVLVSKGGDWERKNKLKVYEALFLMSTRQFKLAAELFLNSIATFTATELISFDMCVFYTVILAVVSLDRPLLLSTVVDNPDILSAIDSVEHLRSLLTSLHECEYGEFFKALAGISDSINNDMLLHTHFRYYLKEARTVVYSQFLQSYKSVKMDTMAARFGIPVEFLDEELANFIVEGRIPAKIDRVDGIVETTRPDPKNAAYQNAIRQGDHVLNKLQKLSKLVET